MATYVADTNGLGFPTGKDLLHLLPGFNVVPFLDDVARTVRTSGELVVIACTSISNLITPFKVGGNKYLAG